MAFVLEHRRTLAFVVTLVVLVGLALATLMGMAPLSSETPTVLESPDAVEGVVLADWWLNGQDMFIISCALAIIGQASCFLT